MDDTLDLVLNYFTSRYEIFLKHSLVFPLVRSGYLSN